MADPDNVAERLPLWPISECDACKAPIIWALTRSLDKVCVDPDPAAPPAGQKAVLLTSRGSSVAPVAELTLDTTRWAGRRTVRRRHLDTCPFQAHYRQRAQRRRA
jgi:hypothetical protein